MKAEKKKRVPLPKSKGWFSVAEVAASRGVTGAAVRYWIKTLGLEVARRFPIRISLEALDNFFRIREQIGDPRGGARPGAGRKARGGKFSGGVA